MDFGAGHSVYHQPDHFAQARELLAPYPNVVLLLPSPDLDESLAIFQAAQRQQIDGMDLNRFFTPRLLKLAKQVIYTDGKSPEETAAEVAALVPGVSAGEAVP